MVIIPQIVFTKYSEFAEAMVSPSGFGAACKLVYVEETEIINNNVPNIKARKVMNVQDTAPNSGFTRGGTSFKTTEITEDIILRIYWDKRDFKRFGSIQVPDGSIMTIGKYSDLGKVNKAKALLIYSDRTGNVEWRFVKSAEPSLHGLNNQYFMCFWSRA